MIQTLNKMIYFFASIMYCIIINNYRYLNFIVYNYSFNLNESKSVIKFLSRTYHSATIKRLK